MNTKIFTIIISFCSLLVSCSQENTKNENTKDTVVVSEIKVQTKISETKEDISKKLIGRWNFNHEPTFYEFKEDMTYSIGAEMYEGAEGVEIYETGKWSVSGENITFAASTGELRTEKVNFFKNIVYFGDIPEKFNPEVDEFSSAEELFSEYGYTKN